LSGLSLSATITSSVASSTTRLSLVSLAMRLGDIQDCSQDVVRVDGRDPRVFQRVDHDIVHFLNQRFIAVAHLSDWLVLYIELSFENLHHESDFLTTGFDKFLHLREFLTVHLPSLPLSEAHTMWPIYSSSLPQQEEEVNPPLREQAHVGLTEQNKNEAAGSMPTPTAPSLSYHPLKA